MKETAVVEITLTKNQADLLHKAVENYCDDGNQIDRYQSEEFKKVRIKTQGALIAAFEDLGF